MKDAFEQLMGVKLAVVIAGFLGAVIQLSMHPQLSLRGAFFSLLAGLCAAAFVQPVLSHYYVMPSQADGVIGFLLGLLGLQITAKIWLFVNGLSVPEIISKLIKK